MRILGLLSFLLLGPALWAQLQLGGVHQQGGFVVGETAPGAEVTIGDSALTVPAEGPNAGRFVWGIPRLLEGPLRIQATLPDGRVAYATLPLVTRDYPTQHITGVPPKTVTPDPAQVARSREEARAIVAARGQISALKGWQEDFMWPVSDTLSGFYGARRTFNGQERSWHKGVDVAAPTGTPIIAPASGRVVLARDTFFNGNLIILDHGAGMFSIYAHLDQMALPVGTLVQQGDLLGTVGNTGRSTGPHLHWGIYWQQVAIDPLLWLQKQPIIGP